MIMITYIIRGWYRLNEVIHLKYFALIVPDMLWAHVGYYITNYYHYHY